MKIKTSFTITQECKDLLAKIAEAKGLNISAVIEVISREEAKRLKIK